MMTRRLMALVAATILAAVMSSPSDARPQIKNGVSRHVAADVTQISARRKTVRRQARVRAAAAAPVQSWRDDRYPQHVYPAARKGKLARRGEGWNQPTSGRRVRTAARAARADVEAAPAASSFFTGGIVGEARRHLGATAGQLGLRRTLWCGAFVDMVLRRTGHQGGANSSLYYARYGSPAPGPAPGVLAIRGRRGGGHVEIVTAVNGDGTYTSISGNTRDRGRGGHYVAEFRRPIRGVIAWRYPS